MSYNITIHANTASELQKEILDLAKLVGAELLTLPAQLTLPLSAVPTGNVAGKKPGRPKTEVVSTEDEVEESSEISVADIKKGKGIASKPAVTFVDVKTALKKVAEAISLEKAQELVKQYGADRVSALKETDYAQFVKACDLALVN